MTLVWARNTVSGAVSAVKWATSSAGTVFDVLARVSGIVLAASGLAHLVAPRPFVLISKPFFPEKTEKWVVINGLSEAAIGLALIERRSRSVGVVALLAYGVYLAERILCFAVDRMKR